MLKMLQLNVHTGIALLIVIGASHTVRAVPCRGNATVAVGATTISSESYPNDYEDYTFCRYYVEGPENTQVKLTFTGEVFDVENAIGCVHDAVGIFDPRTSAAAISLGAVACSRRTGYTFGPFCGTTKPATVSTVRGNKAVVEFCTDYEMTGKGWQIDIEYIPVTPPPVWDTPTITIEKLSSINIITSPNFPSPFLENYFSNYIIKNTNRQWTVQFKALVFDLGRDCASKLVIRDVTNGVSKSFCGVPQNANELTFFEVANSEEIHVEFRSQDPEGNRGFSLEVTTLGCPHNLFACDDDNGCYHPNASCNGVNDCNDGSDEKWQYCAPECGVPHFPLLTDNAARANKIVGGVIANKNSLPWQAAILHSGWAFAGNGNQGCGGTIISDRWILSAAHCFHRGRGAGFNPDAQGWNSHTGYSVRIGGHKVTMDDDDEGSIDIKVAKLICHPYYLIGIAASPAITDFDVCLLKLEQPIPFRKNIAPACLPRQGEPIPAPGTRCLTTGWGGRSEGGIPSDYLRQVYVPMVSKATCNAAYSNRITDTMLCAGTVVGGLDTCQGDSGGPFVCPTNDGRWQVSGVVSWGAGCARPNIPGVYARTSAFTHWITDQIVQN